MIKIKDDIKISISNMADILQVHQRTLRIWDKERILTSKRTSKNIRYYTLDDIKKAEFILFLTRNLLVNLNAVKIILVLLTRVGVEIGDYIKYINKVAKLANIDEKKQKENIFKNSKRGRKTIKI